jgi:hypothetical protein
MLYPKNVPNLKRVLRIVLGLVLIGVALFGQPLIGTVTPLGTTALIFSAAGVIITGFVGWCPACALIGRKIKSNPQNEPTN